MLGTFEILVFEPLLIFQNMKEKDWTQKLESVYFGGMEMTPKDIFNLTVRERKSLMFSRNVQFNENEFGTHKELSDGMDQKLVKIEQSFDDEDLSENSDTPLRRQSTSEDTLPVTLGSLWKMIKVLQRQLLYVKHQVALMPNRGMVTWNRK